MTIVPSGVSQGADDERVNRAINRAVQWLKSHSGYNGNQLALKSMVLLKAGEKPNSPHVADGIQDVLSRCGDGGYQPAGNDYATVYRAGVDAMLLAAADAKRYRSQIGGIANYLIETQLPTGGWDYPNGVRPTTRGDTSASQYACLGLWSASQAGVEIPRDVWQKVLSWHVGAQLGDGGFAYCPGTKEGEFNGLPQHNTTGGASCSMLIALLHLYPGAAEQIFAEYRQSKSARFGVLKKDSGVTKPNEMPSGGEQAAIKGAYRWMMTRFRTENMNHQHVAYYYYTLERMMALARTPNLGSIDWYGQCLEHVLPKQNSDGSWVVSAGGPKMAAIDTCLIVLFIQKTTAKMLGGGILKAGRGLPDDLSKGFDEEEGKAKELGPLDELLAALENADLSDPDKAAAASSAVVEKIAVDPEALIGQQDRIRELAVYPHPDVQRTALYALGRTGNMHETPLLIDTLEKSYNVDVLVEARNALCFLSRKPNGFGIDSNPLRGIDESASEDEKLEALENWRKQVLAKWRGWWFSVRPYDQRDDIEEFKLRRGARKK